MEKKFKHEFPVMRSQILFNDLHRLATNLIADFTKDVLPLLKRVNLCDDAHIRKYMAQDDMECIFHDAVALNGERLSLFERMTESFGHDFWQPLRAADCEIKSPYEDAFVFAPLPLKDVCGWQREKVLKAVSVKEGKFSIDDCVLRAESVIIPTDRHRQLYDMVCDFCEAFNEKGFRKRSVRDLFVNGQHGTIVPNVKGILLGNVGLF